MSNAGGEIRQYSNATAFLTVHCNAPTRLQSFDTLPFFSSCRYTVTLTKKSRRAIPACDNVSYLLKAGLGLAMQVTKKPWDS